MEKPQKSLFALRPISSEDKGRLLCWRNLEKNRVVMYNSHLISEEEHNEWFRHQITSKQNTNLIFSYTGDPIGTLQLQNHNTEHGTADWAFNFGDIPLGTPRGIGRIMEFFALEFFFERKNIRKLSCQVLSNNPTVMALHEKFGFEKEGVLKKHIKREDAYLDVHLFALFETDWPRIRDFWKPQIFEAIESAN